MECESLPKGDAMTLEKLEEYITRTYGAESSHQISEDPTITVFSRPDNKKWFAATKNIGRRFVDPGQEGRIDILNVKLEPREVASLRTREGFRPAWRMNQNNWVTILLDGSVAGDQIRACLDAAFACAGGKRGKR